jgi:hypothetical protein
MTQANLETVAKGMMSSQDRQDKRDVEVQFQEAIVASPRTLKLCVCLLLTVLGLLSLASPSFAQGTDGSLTGLVSDPQGAAVKGVSVTLTNIDTNYAQTVTTDGSGVYFFKLVPPGNYSLNIAGQGFAKYLQSGIVIQANANATQNVELKVGSAEATVTVTSNAELINTTTSELAMTINEASITELPLNGRDPSALALLAPGMIDANKAGVYSSQNGMSFPNEEAASTNGGRVGSTYYMLDGVSNMDNYLGGNSPTPNPDATREFRLISNNFSAVYGFSFGGVVSMATRSGTNRWHGGLFEFLRNQDFNAANWSNHTLDPLIRNQFGGYVGGPILKNKLFFFFNYQGTRADFGGGASNNQTTTPTVQMLNGDFSGLVDQAEANNSSCGSGYTGPRTLSCGWLNGPFEFANGKPNQLIGSLDPVAVQVTNDGLPGHTSAATGTAPPSGPGQNLAGQMFYSSAALKNIIDEYIGRVDYDLSKNQRLTVRSYVDKFIQPSGDVPGNVLSVLNLTNWTETFGEQMWYFNEIAQHTWTINPSTVNTATVLWTQQSAHNGAAVVDHSGTPMCWSRYIAVVEPACYMEGAVFGGANGGWTPPSSEVRSTVGVYDNLIKSLGRHTVTVGIDLQHQRAEENASNYPADAIIGFGGGYTGNGEADWLLGYMSSFEQGAGELSDIQAWQIEPYVNDEFRVTPALTLTLGLRYAPDIAPVSVGGRGAAFVAGQQSTRFPLSPLGLVFPGDHGVNDALRPSDYNYFEPRIGVAFQPRSMPHTSFHAAFGMFSAPPNYSIYNHAVDIAPFAPAFSPTAPSNVPICSTGGVTSACIPNTGQSITGFMDFHNPWDTSSFGTGGVSPFPPFASIGYKPPADSVIQGPVYLQASFARNFKGSMTQSWNASVEQQFGNTMSLRIAYVGSESYHQDYVVDKNFAGYSYCTSFTSPTCPVPALAPPPVAPYSNFTGILEYDSGATADYHSLQIFFERRMSHGLQAQSSFTWAKAIDVASGANLAVVQSGINNPANLRYSRGISSASIPFSWVSTFTYRSPDLRGHNIFVREVLGAWELSPIITWQSGTPFSIGPGSSQAAYGEPGYGGGCLQFCGGDRADRVEGQPLDVRKGGRSHWLKQYFNPAAFVTRHDGTFGNSYRNLMYSPPGFNVDASLMKNWTIRANYGLQLRFEFFNAFNHPIMGGPDTTPTDSTYTQVNSGQGSVTNVSRVGQAALKFTF